LSFPDNFYNLVVDPDASVDGDVLRDSERDAGVFTNVENANFAGGTRCLNATWNYFWIIY